jgi:hypothetical protein
MELVKEYKTVYTSASGGYVKQSALAKPGRANRSEKGQWVETDEMGLAEKAADEGHEIFFLPKSENAKSPELIIDDQVGDIKHVFTVSKRSIRGAMQRARDQSASTVLMEVSDNFTLEEIREQVEERLRNSTWLKKAFVFWQGKEYVFSK